MRKHGAILAGVLVAASWAGCTTGTGAKGRTPSSTLTPVPTETPTSTATLTPTPLLALRTPVAYSRRIRTDGLGGILQQVYLRVQVTDPYGIAEARVTATGPSGSVAVNNPAPGATTTNPQGELEGTILAANPTVQAGHLYTFQGNTSSVTPVFAFPTAQATIPAVLAFPTVTSPSGVGSSGCFSPINVTATGGSVALSWNVVPGATFYVITAFPVTFCFPSTTPADTQVKLFFQTTATLNNLVTNTDYLVTFIVSDMFSLSIDPLRNGDVASSSFWMHVN